MKAFQWLLAATILAGCAATQGVPATGTAYRGEVWIWDERDSTVTLRDGARMLRVQVTPDQIRGLRMHEIATVRGDLLGPKPIEQIIVPGPALAAVPRGPVARAETTGRIVSMDSAGLMSIDTPQGRVTVWTMNPAQAGFAPGVSVRLYAAVQGADIVPQASLVGTASSDAQQPSALVITEPGEYAIVTGRVVTVDPRGLVTVESPRGPVTVWLPAAASYQPGAAVQVRTSVRAE
jgi:hypothetical protein